MTDDNEEKLRKAALEMIRGYTAQVVKLHKKYPDPHHIMRSNELGYQYQAVDFIIEMAKTYHANAEDEESLEPEEEG